MNYADWVMRAFALFGILVFTYQVGKHGMQWVMSEVAGWFSVARKEFDNLYNDVKNIETRLARVENHPAISMPPLVPPAPPPKS